MADVKISQLPAASTPLAGTEQIPLVQDSTTKQITVSNLLTSANLGTPSAINLANATNVPMAQASGTLAVANGGTGTATPALVAGTNVTISGSWPNQTINSTFSGAVTSVTGTAPVVSSGGATPAISMAAATGSVNGYLTSTDWTTFNNKLTSGGALGTPSSGTATNLTGLPLSTGVTGLLPVANGGTGTATPALVAGSNVTISGTWPNQTIAAAGAAQVYPGAGIANSTGSAWGTSYSTTGSGTVLALATSPTFVTPALGTPASGDFSTGTFTWPTFNQNTSGTAAGLSTTLAVASGGTGQTSYTDGQLLIGNSTGNTLTKATLTAGANITITNSAGGITIAATGGGGSGTVTSVSGTGTVSGITLTGTVTTSGSLTLGGTLDLSSPPAIGGTTPAAITGTTITATTLIVNDNSTFGSSNTDTATFTGRIASEFTPATNNTYDLGRTSHEWRNLYLAGSVTLSGGTANGVTYLNGSKVLTSGSALTFDGTNLTSGGSTNKVTGLSGSGTGFTVQASAAPTIGIWDTSNASYVFSLGQIDADSYVWNGASGSLIFGANNTEGMRLTSTGLGIGTSSPSYKLDVAGSSGIRIAESAAQNGYEIAAGSPTIITSYNRTTSTWLGLRQRALSHEFYCNGSLTATLDSSGNLGLGVTPSAWMLPTIQTQSEVTFGPFGVGRNVYYATGFASKYIANGFASRYAQSSGQHIWETAGNNTSGAGAALTFTQAMTLDASGNLFVGGTTGSSRLNLQMTTNSSTDSSYITLYNAGENVGHINWVNGNGNLARINGTKEGGGASANDGILTFSTAIDSSLTERVRIDSSGRFLLGGTTADNSAYMELFYNGLTYNGIVTKDSSSSSTTYSNVFVKNGSVVGNISQTTTATAYNTSSDYRLKNTIVPMTGALAKVALLKPCTYKWNADGSDGEGFIAHELAEVCPDAVVGKKDAVDADGNPQYQGIDTSFLVATLTAAIQEQQAIIETLKARLDAANL